MKKLIASAALAAYALGCGGTDGSVLLDPTQQSVPPSERIPTEGIDAGVVVPVIGIFHPLTTNGTSPVANDAGPPVVDGGSSIIDAGTLDVVTSVTASLDAGVTVMDAGSPDANDSGVVDSGTSVPDSGALDVGTSVTVDASAGSIVMTFSGPTSDAGASVTSSNASCPYACEASYTYAINDGIATLTGGSYVPYNTASSPCSIDLNNDSYQCAVTVKDSNGEPVRSWTVALDPVTLMLSVTNYNPWSTGYTCTWFEPAR